MSEFISKDVYQESLREKSKTKGNIKAFLKQLWEFYSVKLLANSYLGKKKSSENVINISSTFSLSA